MLKNIRIVLATLVFVLVTLLFLDFTGTAHAWFGWLAKVQLIPAILGLHIAVFLIFAILTLLFGRVYCSVICPLGIYQDLVARIGRRGNKKPYSYSKAKSLLRYVTLGIFVVAMIAGVSVVVALLDPYAAFGRIANNLLQPLWMWGNNLLAYFAQRADSYAFYGVEVWVKSAWVFGVAIATLIVVSILAWRNGRTYCNTICPVGTALGFISRFSLFRIRIDSEKCNKCGLCAINCKSSCIDAKNYAVDSSRCVSCMNCIDKCKRGAISFSLPTKSTERVTESETPTQRDESRRGFITASLLLTATAARSQVLPKQVKMKMDGGLADILPKQTPQRATAITPPGSLSYRNFNNKCTACQLCVSACPNGVLKPSSSLDNFMQPQMSFNHGYCRPECTRCSEVCPAGAITKIDRAEKSAIQIGHAVWVEERCHSAQGEKKCDNCSMQCPVGAITMVDRGFKSPVPMVDTERCIGCGACEYSCPSRPLSAIYVEGHTMHRTI
ncbi:MAG: 4Fe-4S binding protein [Rikenellaceae bacterium]